MTKWSFKTTGMEFASEMIIKATLKSLRITETPITLHPDGRSRPPHLKPWRDGWRHLRFMLIYSPRWLFLFPGLLLCLTGFVAAVITWWAPFQAGRMVLDVGSLLVACMWMIIGVQFVALACFTKVFGIAEGTAAGGPGVCAAVQILHAGEGHCFGRGALAAWDWLRWRARFGSGKMADLARWITAKTCGA